MNEPSDRRKAFEARLAALQQKMESGLVDRARTLRQAAQRLIDGDETARSQLKTEGHKLRGIAGSYGHDDLTQLAGTLEQKASIAPPASVASLAHTLADAAERTGTASGPPPPASPASGGSDAPGSRRVPGKLKGERPQARSSAGGPLRVLAMDDEPNTRQLLTLTLKQVGGFDAVILDSGSAALAELDVRQYDVVVSDAMMPDMSGRDFITATREKGGYCLTLPIIILSAATKSELGWSEALQGPTTWLRKPFSPTWLVKEVAAFAQAQRGS